MRKPESFDKNNLLSNGCNGLQLQRALAVMLVNAVCDAVYIGGGHELRAAEAGCAEENARGFIGHEHRGGDGVRRGTERDDTMVFQQNDARDGAEFLAKTGDFDVDCLRQAQARIAIRHEDGGGTTADDLIWEKAAGGEFARARRAKDLVHRNRVRVADETDAGQAEQVGVEERLDGRLFRGGIHAAAEEFVLDLLVGEVVAFEHREQWGEAAFHEIVFRKRAEAAAAGFDEEGVVAEPRGGVAFAENGELAILATELMGKVEQA